MNTNIDLKGLAGRAKQNIGLTLWAGLAVLIILEGLVVREAVSVLLNSRQIVASPRTQPVRVNFNLYETIIKRFDEQSLFAPTPVTAQSPFGIIETIPPKP